MDPEKITPETTPLNNEPIEEKNLFQVPDHLSESTTTPSINMGSINIDPKFLAGKLEDTRSDEKDTSDQLFHQPFKQVQTLESTQSSISEAPVQVQVVEKIVYQKQRIHGFFRTLTLITLLFVGVLMLLEMMNIFSLNIGGVTLNTFYPIVVILSVIVIWSYRGIFGKILGFLMFLSVVAGFFVLSVYSSLTPSTLITTTGSTVAFSLDSGYAYSKVYVDTLLNSLTIQSQSGKELLLSQYDAERPMSLISGYVQSGHSYAILQESDNINLLERVYTHLDIGLHQTQPIYLYANTFIGENTLDLQQVNVRGLRVHGGIMSLNLTLGSSIMSGSKIDLEAAVGDVTIHIPKTVAVHLSYKSLLGMGTLPGFSEQEKDIFVSNNIDKATSIVDIDARWGLSKFTIVRDR